MTDNTYVSHANDSLEVRVAALAQEIIECKNQAMQDVAHIVKPELGGNTGNVLKVLPQLWTGSEWDSRLNVGCSSDRVVDEDELAAAVVVASRVAAEHHQGNLKEVTIDEITASHGLRPGLSDLKYVYEQLTAGRGGSCNVR